MLVKARKGTTLAEVIAGAIILAIVFGGLLSTFISVRRYINRANKRLIAINLISRELNDLYPSVDASTWDSGDLRIGSRNLDSYNIDDQVYQDSASPNNLNVRSTTGQYRQATVTINYP